MADLIVSVSSDGVVTSHGPDLPATLASEPALEVEFTQDQEAVNADAKVIDPLSEGTKDRKAIGKLILAEEVPVGQVNWKPIRFLIKSLSGDHVTFFLAVWIGGSIFEYLMHSFNVWFLGYWSSRYEDSPSKDIPAMWYMMVYVLLVLVRLVAYIGKESYYMLGMMRASRSIHKVISQAILGTTLRWLDETPMARILQRMTLDMDVIDTRLMREFNALQSGVLTMIVNLASAVMFVPLFTLPGFFIAVFAMYMGKRYLKAQISVRREMSNSRAPMLTHFSAAISGLVSLRAYGAGAAYQAELRKRIDHYVRLARLYHDLNRWINVRIDMVKAVFAASLAAYLTYGSKISAANVGFSLNQAVMFCQVMLHTVRVFNAFLIETNNLDRVVAYTEVEQEPKPTEQGRPPAAWPTSGDIRAENLTARYSKSGPTVLHGLTFNIRTGERIGVVGRTGSGKSSLTLALLRCIITEGNVYFNGLKTNEINLDALRSNITIIPQIPELFSGTLRYNLDPFEEFDDATLNHALQASGLYSSVVDGGECPINLDSIIAGGGSNVSVGQRQIIALARAIIRSSKLLILDEATSAIDHQTDKIIQNTLRRELGTDVTVLTIAHRLQTIMDSDRILVLDAGRIVEFASPADLLARSTGIFKGLVDESVDRQHLYKVARGKGHSSTS